MTGEFSETLMPLWRRLARIGAVALGIAAVVCLLRTVHCVTRITTPIDVCDVPAPWPQAVVWFVACLACGLVFALLLRGSVILRWPDWCVLAAAAVLLTAAACRYRWELRLLGAPSLHAMPVDSRGYVVEKLPFAFAASFARGTNVYFADARGDVYRSDDADPAAARIRLGGTGMAPPRMLFVSARGTLFVSSMGLGTMRSTDGGMTWEKCHDWSFWRMDEDEAAGVLYAGNYTPKQNAGGHAAVFKSTDDGKSWREVFTDRRLHHVHTVRFDDRFHRLYIATGDAVARGQLYTDDGGTTWHAIIAGRKQGNTDVAIAPSAVFWGSDDWLGRIVCAPRDTPDAGRSVLWCDDRQIWFLDSSGSQLYAGTMAERPSVGDAVYLAASADEGKTWQKLLALRASKAGMFGFTGDSRRCSAGGWLYFATVDGAGYRVRRESSSR